ncbi:MAG: glycosyltransferase [Candidatus Omnitrophica bacterium]|nr:glycosyltransferase [Candidatus Omnitrophota bacterium]
MEHSEKPAVVLLVRVDGNFGGVERYILNLAENLDRRFYYPVVVPLANHGELERQSVEKGLPVEFIPMSGRVRILPAVRRLAEVVRKWDAGLIHTFGLRSNTLAGLLRRPPSLPWVIRLPNINSADYANPVRGWLSHEFNNFWIRRANALQVISPHLEAYVKRWRHPPRRVYYIPNGVDPAVYDPSRFTRPVRAAWGIPEDALVIGSAGRLDRVKGFDHLLRAFRAVLSSHPAAWLLLAGAGPDESRLRQSARTLGIGHRTVFTGYVADVRPCLAAMDLFVCSSISEGVPMALLEAMAMEKPIITTRVGGIDSILENGAEGRFAEQPGWECLAAAIEDLIGHPEQARHMGRAARHRVLRDLTTGRMVEKVQTMYHEIRKEA